MKPTLLFRRTVFCLFIGITVNAMGLEDNKALLAFEPIHGSSLSPGDSHRIWFIENTLGITHDQYSFNIRKDCQIIFRFIRVTNNGAQRTLLENPIPYKMVDSSNTGWCCISIFKDSQSSGTERFYFTANNICHTLNIPTDKWKERYNGGCKITEYDKEKVLWYQNNYNDTSIEVTAEIKRILPNMGSNLVSAP